MDLERVIHPSQATIDAFANESMSSKPIVMLNLLRFREVADYTGADVDPGPISGRDAYQCYSRAVVKPLWRTGGQVLWAGSVRTSLIAPSYEQWDRALLVYYPSRAAFIRMVSSEDYQRVVVHRTAALEDSRLLETRAARLPKVVLGASRLAVRAWGRIGGAGR